MHTGSRNAQFVVKAPASPGVYLGANVNPFPGQGEEQQTEALENSVYGNNTTHFALHLQYLDWVGMSTVGSYAPILADIAHNRVPIISMHCGDDIQPHSANTPLNLIQIAYGQADNDLANIKNQLLLLKYPGTNNPYPVILRFFWEFNINAGQVAPAFDNAGNGNNNCFVTPGSPTGVTAEPTAPPLSQQFTDAWIHIHNQLTGSGAPVPQLTYDWNPNVVPDSSSGQLSNIADPKAYFPTGYVDWIGVDGYSVLGSSGEPENFDQIFGQFFGNYSSYNLPMMVGETASCQAYTDPPMNSDQAVYIHSLETKLQTSTYSQVRALLYFDADGQYHLPSGASCHWILNSAPVGNDPISGIQAFTTLAQDPYFSPTIKQP